MKHITLLATLLTLLYVPIALLYVPIASAHTGHEDVSYIYNHSTKVLIVMSKDGHHLADQCADGLRTNYRARVIKVAVTDHDGRIRIVTCKK